MSAETNKEIFERFKDMIHTDTVVGKPIHIGDAVIIPFVDVTFGFGEGHKTEGISGGGGGRIRPTAVLIMKGERMELFSIKNAATNSTVDRLLNLVPEVVSRFSGKKAKREEVREAALREAKEAMREEEEKAKAEATSSTNSTETTPV